MKEPKWRQIANDLSQKIEAGELAPGSPLAELELRYEYGNASRNTIRDATEWLKARRLIEDVPGHGLFVVDRLGPERLPDRTGSALRRASPGIYIPLDNTSVGVYLRIADDLRRRIESGTLYEGFPLYQGVLREHYRSSRQSISDALSWLAARNYIRSQPGRASFVLEGNVRPEILTSADASLEAGGVDFENVVSRLEFGCALAAECRQGQVEARATGYGTSYGDYFAGRYLPSSEHLREILGQCGVTDEQRIMSWLQTLARLRTLFPEPESERSGSGGDERLNLIFRVYIPSNRLYSSEADRLLTLFQDWLTRVRRLNIRYEGRRTAAGRVCEFWASTLLEDSVLPEEFTRFSGFLALCTSNPGAAAERLVDAGIDAGLSSVLVTEFAKEARRLELDAKHDRERLMLSIRHALEAQSVDEATGSDDPPASGLNELLDALLPVPIASAPISMLMSSEHRRLLSPVVLNVHNPQFINAIRSTIAQHIDGSAHYGIEAKEILCLIDRFGGQESVILTSALHEIEDDDARFDDRMDAMSRLKRFLGRCADSAQEVATSLLVSYVERRVGL